MPTGNDIAELKVKDLARATLRPGDRLMVRMHDGFTTSQLREIGDYIKAFVPDNDVLVLPACDVATLAEAPDPEHRGRIVITWPATDGAPVLANWGVAVHDADTGDQILTGYKISLVLGTDTGYDSAPIEADITALIDEDGNILGPRAEPTRDGDEYRTGVFRFAVAEMRVADHAA